MQGVPGYIGQCVGERRLLTIIATLKAVSFAKDILCKLLYTVDLTLVVDSIPGRSSLAGRHIMHIYLKTIGKVCSSCLAPAYIYDITPAYLYDIAQAYLYDIAPAYLYDIAPAYLYDITPAYLYDKETMRITKRNPRLQK